MFGDTKQCTHQVVLVGGRERKGLVRRVEQRARCDSDLDIAARVLARTDGEKLGCHIYPRRAKTRRWSGKDLTGRFCFEGRSDTTPSMSTVDSTGMLRISSSVPLPTSEGTTSCTVPCESLSGKKYRSFPAFLEPRESLMRCLPGGYQAKLTGQIAAILPT